MSLLHIGGGGLPPDLLSLLDFSRAVERVLVDTRTDFILSQFEGKILEAYADVVVSKVQEGISSGHGNGLDYEPQPLRLIDVPKKDFTVRQGAIPTIRDRVYFQALADTLAPTVESAILDKQTVFSYRLTDVTGPKMFGSPSESYAEFSKKLNDLCVDSSYSHVVDADVASYFDHIYHHFVVNTLDGFGCAPVVINALGGLLRKWRNGVSHGIPQGLWPSDLIGNFYLHPLDHYMVSEGWEYHRYVDDIRVFVRSKTDGRKALLSMSRKLGLLGLSLNSAKTDIMSKSDFCAKLTPITEKLQGLISKRKAFLKSVNPYFNEFEPSARNALRQDEIAQVLAILRNATSQYSILEGDVKFCLNVLFGNDLREAKVAAAGLLLDNPHLTSYVVNYLASTPYDPDVGRQLVEFLRSPDNIYDWQEMWILRYFFATITPPDGLRPLLRSIVSNRNKNNATRCVAIHLLGEIGEYADWQAIKERMRSEESEWVRTYVVLGIRKLPKAERNYSYDHWKTLDWQVDLAVRYIKERLGPN